MKNKISGQLFINESFLASVTVFVAGSLRILHVIFTSRLNPLAGNVTLDSLLYDRWAKALVWGGEAGSTRLMQAPLFPWTVSAIYRIFGPDLTAVRAFHAILGTLTCLFIIIVTRRLFRSSTAGILAGVFYALYLPAIFYEGVLVPATLILFLDALFLFLLVTESGFPGRWRLVSAGAVLGLSVITKPVALLLLPFALIHLMLRAGKFSRQDYRPRHHPFPGPAAAFTAGFLMIASVLPVRNYLLAGEFIPLTTGGGINFYIGCNPKANGYYSVPFYKGTSLGGTPEEQQSTMHRIASRESGRELSYSGVSRFWTDKGIEYASANPVRWASLTWQKLIFFWNGYERSNVENLYFHRQFGGILALPLFTFGFIAPLGLLGIFLSRERHSRLWLLYGGITVYFSAALIFYVLARYRLPVAVFLIPMAGSAVASLLKLIRDRKFMELVLMAVALFLISRLVNTTVAKDTPSGIAGQYVRLAVVHDQRGDRENAESALLKALDLDPGNTMARERLRALRNR